MQLGTHTFHGPFIKADHVVDTLGVFVVVDLVEGDPERVQDIGNSTGDADDTATSTNNLRYRILTHRRREWWDAEREGRIGYLVHYTDHIDKIIELQSRLEWMFDPACGKNQWQRTEEWVERYEGMRDRFGERGSFDIGSIGMEPTM